MIQFAGARPRESAAFKARWSKFPKMAISVYPWRDEPEVHTIPNMNTHIYKWIYILIKYIRIYLLIHQSS